MAGDWIAFECATLEKPEVYKLARMLGVSKADAILLLLTFWVWVDRNFANAEVTQLVTQDIDKLMHCDGFAHAMRTIGWLHLDDENERITIPGFEVHHGKSAKKRLLTARRVAKHKRIGNADGNATGNAGSVTNALPTEQNRREDLKAIRPVAPDGFTRFWQAWPASERKVSKAKCLELWKRRKLDQHADEIVAHVTAMRDSKQWRDGYDPAPLTYLNQTRWEDGLPAAASVEKRVAM